MIIILAGVTRPVEPTTTRLVLLETTAVFDSPAKSCANSRTVFADNGFNEKFNKLRNSSLVFQPTKQIRNSLVERRKEGRFEKRVIDLDFLEVSPS